MAYSTDSQPGATVSNSDTKSLELDENYFGSRSSDFMNLNTVEEIEAAIVTCREKILSLPEMSVEKRQLVQQLVQMRLRLTDVRDMKIYSDPMKVKIISSHKFVGQTVQLKLPQSSQLHCDACAGVIWIPVQSWFTCSECSYISHVHCLDSVKRVCAAVLIDANPGFISQICPEKGLEDQNFMCAECKTGISYS